MKKLGSNAYIVDLPSDCDISSTFNVSDLIKYKEPITIPSNILELDPFLESEPHPKCPPPTIPRKHDRINKILDKQVVSTRRCGYQ